MLFTIAIPTYNGAKKLSKAIESAINQNYNNDYEILIVNNNSTDNTQDIIDSYSDSRIKCIINKETVDMFENHNICFREAKGEYLVFCHTDDELTKDALSILDKELEKLNYPSKMIIWGQRTMGIIYQCFLTSGQPINTVVGGENAVKSVLRVGTTPSGTCYPRKSVIELGLFPPMKTKLDNMDWYILLVAAYEAFEFKMIDRLLFLRESSSTAISSLTVKDWLIPKQNVLNEVFNKISNYQKWNLINLFLSNPYLELYPILKNFWTRKQRLIFFYYFIKKNGLLKLLFNFNVIFMKIKPIN